MEEALAVGPDQGDGEDGDDDGHASDDGGSNDGSNYVSNMAIRGM